MLTQENAYCISIFTVNAGISKWLSGRHLKASLAWAIRNEPEIYSKDRKNLKSQYSLPGKANVPTNVTNMCPICGIISSNYY